MVRVRYIATTARRIVAAMAVSAVFTGIRNATRPAKKNRRDACRRRATMSTTACILNLFKP
jgi:hypothetical protein